MASSTIKNISAPLPTTSTTALQTPSMSFSASPPPATTQPKICVFCASAPGISPSHRAAARSLAESMHNNGIHLVYGGGTVGIMGEVAKTLVSLSGKEAVEGVIPRSVIGHERPQEAGDTKDTTEEGHQGDVEREGTGVGDGEINAAAETKQEVADKPETEQQKKANWWNKLQKRRQSKQDTSQATTTEKQHDQSKKTWSDIAIDMGNTFGAITVVPNLSERKIRMARAIAEAGDGSGFIALTGGFGTLDEVMEMITWSQFGVHKRRVAFYSVDGYWDHVDSWMEKAITAGFVRETMREVVAVRPTAEGCVQWLRDGV